MARLVFSKNKEISNNNNLKKLKKGLLFLTLTQVIILFNNINYTKNKNQIKI